MTPRNYRAKSAPMPHAKFCWYRRGLLHWCGHPTLRASGLCRKHDAILKEEIERLDKLVNKHL